MKVIIVWLVGLLFAGNLPAGLVAWNSLIDIQQRPDLIAVGSIVEGRGTAADADFTVRIARVLKGDAGLAGKDLLVRWALDTSYSAGPRDSGAASPLASVSGLWFLQHNSGPWVVVPVMQGGIFFSQTFIRLPAGDIAGAYSYSPAAPLADKVASEISAAIEFGNPSGNGLDTLFFGILDELGSPVLQVLYHRLAAANSPNLRALGLSGLIRNGDPAALQAALEQSSSFSRLRENNALVQSIRDVFRSTDPAAIAILGRMAVDSKAVAAGMREASAHALRSIHSVAALPYLAQLLDDPDADLRGEGVGGLAAFANGLPVQTNANVANFGYLRSADQAPYKTEETMRHFAMGRQAIQQKEQEYLVFWKSWWAEHRWELGQ
jgi:hypothetical protein